MGAFKKIITKLQSETNQTGRHLSEDDKLFLWVFDRPAYYRITKRINGPKEPKEILKGMIL